MFSLSDLIVLLSDLTDFDRKRTEREIVDSLIVSHHARIAHTLREYVSCMGQSSDSPTCSGMPTHEYLTELTDLGTKIQKYRVFMGRLLEYRDALQA